MATVGVKGLTCVVLCIHVGVGCVKSDSVHDPLLLTSLYSVGSGPQDGDIGHQWTANARNERVRACSELLPVTCSAGDQRPIRSKGCQ